MCSDLTAPEAKKPAISTNAPPPLRQEMVFQVTLVLYSCWLFLRLVRDPVSAFPWILPLVVVTRSLDNLPVVGERLALFDLFLVLWCVLFFLSSLARRHSPSLPREALLVLLLYGLFLGVNALSLLDAIDPVRGVVALARIDHR